jgi:hypothetical protein
MKCGLNAKPKYRKIHLQSLIRKLEEKMKRSWRVKRQTVARLDGQRRWDQVYQRLIEWQTVTQELKPVDPKRNKTEEGKSDDQ